MAEPTVRVPVSRKQLDRLVKRVERDLDRGVYHTTGQESDVRDLRLAVLALLSQPTPTTEPWYCGRCGGSASEHARADSICIWEPVPTAEPMTNKQAWADGFEAGATWPQHTASGIPVDPPVNPYESDRTTPAEPPRIEDMAPGTTFFAEGKGVHGVEHHFRVQSNGMTLFCLIHGTGAKLAYVDPSTIRDVTPPKDAS